MKLNVALTLLCLALCTRLPIALSMAICTSLCEFCLERRIKANKVLVNRNERNDGGGAGQWE